MPTLNNKIMFLRSLSDAWSLYASSTFTAGNPVTRVQIGRGGLYGRSTDTSSGTPAYIRFDAGGAGVIDPDDLVVWMGYIRHDGDAGTLKYRVRFSTSSTFSSTTYDSGSGGVAMDQPFADRVFAHHLHAAAAGAVSQYVEVSFWATSASYIDIGRIMVGEPWQPAKNVQRSGLSEPSVREKVGIVSGSRQQEFDIAGTVFLEADGMLYFEDESDLRTEYNDLLARVGSSGNVLYCGDPLDTTYRQHQFVCGRFTQLSVVDVRDGYWAASFAVQEYH